MDPAFSGGVRIYHLLMSVGNVDQDFAQMMISLTMILTDGMQDNNSKLFIVLTKSALFVLGSSSQLLPQHVRF